MEDIASSEDRHSNPSPQQRSQASAPRSSGSPPQKKVIIEIAAGILAVFVLGGLFYYVSVREGGRLVDRESGEVFQLVADTVSQSAAIRIHLPAGMSVAQAREAVTFTPLIEGSWLEGGESDTLLYQPRHSLALGNYYSVTLSVNGAEIKKEFRVDEDPQVIAVFPAEGETNEFSEITVVFNRPMVPLTALDSPLTAEIPIEIAPHTAGRFKWITTRSVQFIPENRLQRATTYSVRVKDGFVSLDGLDVPQFSHEFTTRPLRLEHMLSGTLGYSRPAILRFNQPVDIEATRAHIEVIRVSDGEESVPFVLAYGTRHVYDPARGRTTEYLDRSIIEVYNEKDSHGRDRLWDFDTAYRITLTAAFPAEGDLSFAQRRTTLVSISDIITSLNAESDRSRYVAHDMFDPQGRLSVTFAEEIDKERSSFEVPGLVDIEYGERCKRDEDGNIIYLGRACETEVDRTTLYFRFDERRLSAGDSIVMRFRRVVNSSGLQLNREPLSKTISVYGPLVISKTTPAHGSSGADLTRMIVCTNTPLQPANIENFHERVRFNTPIGLWNWHAPYRVTLNHRAPSCGVGEFVNTIQYGLPPERDVEIRLDVIDDFGQSAQRTVRFTTGELEGDARKFIHMQKAYNVTPPHLTTLTYAVENFSHVNMSICAVSPHAMLDALAKRNIGWDRAPHTLPCASRITDTITLPDRFWTRNFFQVSLGDYIEDPLGHYVITFSHPDYQRTRSRYDSGQQRWIYGKTGELIYEHTLLSVTNLAVQEKRIGWEGDGYDEDPATTARALEERGYNLYWISEIGSLRPVHGARVDVYRNIGGRNSVEPTRAHIAFADAEGVAKTPPVRDHVGAIISYGADSAIVEVRHDRLQWESAARSATRIYMYTDRPIYRPGQEVFIKGIHRAGYDAEYEVLAGRSGNVRVINSRGETVFEKEVVLNEYGTFELSFPMDVRASLGTYRISAFGGTAHFDVEEYVPSAFRVELKPDKEEYVAGDTLLLDVQADYFFGVPLDGGEVSYTITAQNYIFDRFGDSSYFFGERQYYGYGGRGDTFLLRGRETVNAQGNVKITQELDFEKLFRDDERGGSKIFVVDATVRDANGRSVSSQSSFLVHRGDRYLGIKIDTPFTRSGERFAASVKSVDIQGQPVRISGGALEVVKVTWERFQRREVDGGYYYSWEQKKEQVYEKPIHTSASGDFSETLVLDEPGVYEVVARTTDTRGNEIRAVRQIYIYGSGSVSVRPTNNEALDLATDVQDLDVGEEANIVIQSPYPNAKALVTFERGTIFDYKIIDIDSNLVNYRFVVDERHIPNVFVSVLLLAPDPAIKFGQINYRINAKRKTILIDIATDKTHYLPGEEVRVSLTAKDIWGRPVSAELSVAVADLSVLALKGNPKKNPVVFFYGGMPLAITTASNIKNLLPETTIPLGTKGGGGAAAPEDLAQRQRGIFKDTAFWDGAVHTDASGRATLSFVLPDNLTQWQIEAVGVSSDTRLGVGYADFISRKEVMLTPLVPRFIIPSDTFMVGARIFNETDRNQRLAVSLDAPTLSLVSGDMRRTVEIGAKRSETVYFSVKAPPEIRDGAHEITLSARNNNYDDTVLQSIPIRRNNTYEAVATAHFTRDAGTKEFILVPGVVEPDRGELQVSAGATLAVFLSDALRHMVAYPDGSSEHIASRLGAISVVKKGLDIENVAGAFALPTATFEGREYTMDEMVRAGLARLYENQTFNGGFSYYKNTRPSFYLTLHIAKTLRDLQEAGFAVNQNAINRAATYIFNEISRDSALRQSRDTVILAAYTLSHIGAQSTHQDQLRSMVLPLVADDRFLNEQISYVALAQLAMLSASGGYPDLVRDKIYSTLENKVVIDARGAHIGVRENARLYHYYETPAKNTALLVKALVKGERESAVMDSILRWIVASRAKDGSWGSTHNTLAVVDAFSDFLRWQKETESEYSLRVTLDDDLIGEFDFGPDTILDMMRAVVPMEQLKKDRFQELVFSKENRNDAVNTLYYDISLRYFLSIGNISPRDEGFGVERALYAMDDTEFSAPLSDAQVGDVLRGRMVVTVPKHRLLVAIEDFIPAGTEIVNLGLATEDQSLRQDQYDGFGGLGGCVDCLRTPETVGGRLSVLPRHGLGYAGEVLRGILNTIQRAVPRTPGELTGRLPDLPDEMYANRHERHMRLRPDHEELRDDRIFLFAEQLRPGVYYFEYFVRALVPGEYQHLPAVASEMYFPETFGRTGGDVFRIHR